MYSFVLLLIITSIVPTNAFYSSSDDVIELDALNFDRLVTQSSDVWFVEFYAPWCGRKYFIH